MVSEKESEVHAAYLKSLPQKDPCRHARSIGLDICRYDGYCRFQGELQFSLSLGKVPECKRDKVLRLMSIFKK